MNFDLDRILTRMGGENLNTRVSGMRVMNDTPPTPRQIAELQHKFRLHQLNIRTSIAGFLTRDGVLSDGSRYRIVSNSGIHHLMLWPVERPTLKQIVKALLKVFCIPADTTDQYGWIAPAVSGANGTTAASGTRATAGAVLQLQEDKTGVAPVLKGVPKTFSRYQSVLLPTTSNVDFSSKGFSAQNWEHREWVSPDFKTVVTSTDKIRVNDVDYGVGPFGDTLFTCIYPYTAPGAPAPAPYFFAVGVSAGTTGISFARAPVGLSPSWDVLATLDVTTLDASAVVDPTGDHTMRYWIKKVTANASRTVCSLWLQNPFAEGQAHDGTKWVGIVDIDMSTGTITSTRAEGEVTRYTEDAHPADNATFTWKHSTTGVRQIAFSYDGDTKVFTELHFSGALQADTTYTRGTSGAAINDYSIDIITTDSREVTLVQGSFTQRIGWVDYAVANTHHESQSNSATSVTHSWSRTFDATHHIGVIDYYGGHRGDLLMVKTVDVHNEIAGSGSGFSSGTFLLSSYSETTTPGITVERKIYEGGAQLLDNGSGVFSTEVQTTASPGPFKQGTPAGSAIDTNPALVQAWGGASNIATNLLSYDVAPYALNLSVTPTDSRCLFNLGARGTNGHPAYVAVGAAPDPSAMNARTIGNEFTIVSVPKIGANGKPSTSQFQTYCSDAASATIFNVDAISGILKGLRLK